MSFSYGAQQQGQERGRVMEFPQYKERSDQSNKAGRVTKVVTKTKAKSNRFTLVLMVLLSIYAIIAFTNQYYKIHLMNQEMSKVNSQLLELQQKNNDLKEQINRMQSAAYVEREARKKLGLVKPGEKIIVPAYQAQ